MKMAELLSQKVYPFTQNPVCGVRFTVHNSQLLISRAPCIKENSLETLSFFIYISVPFISNY